MDMYFKDHFKYLTYTDFLQGSIFGKTIWLIEKIFSEDAFLKTSYSLTLYSWRWNEKNSIENDVDKAIAKMD